MVLLQYTYVGVANSNLNETALINKSWDLRLPSGILSIMQYFQKTQKLNPKIKKKIITVD